MRDDDVTGVDPSVFRRYFRDEAGEEKGGSEGEEGGGGEVNLAGDTAGYNRADNRDYKMPRRKTTKRRKGRKADTDKYVFLTN